MLIPALYIAIVILLIQVFSLNSKIDDLQDKLTDAETRVKNAVQREDAIIDIFINKEDATQ